MAGKSHFRGISVAGWWLSVLLALGSTALAQSSDGIIAGSASDLAGHPLVGATVTLTTQGGVNATNDNGNFLFPDVRPGTYVLKATYVGFAPYETQVKVAAGQTLNLTLTLEVATKKEEVIVEAPRAAGEAAAINETRTADNILQVLPANVIVSLPNANVADAIGRFPSVTLYRDEGEGEYIQVRGTEPRLTNVTVDGITIPAPEPTVRQVRLDIIPSDMVASIELNKTLSASQDADGIGGSVNLVTRSAGDRPTYTVFTDGGYTPIMNGRAVESSGGTFGQRFGAAHRLGILANGSFDYNGRGIDNIQPAIDPLSTFAQPFYDNDTIRQYRYYRYRFGVDGSADYRFSEASSIFLHGFYTDLKDWGDKWYYEPVSNALTCPSTAPGACADGANVVLPSPAAASSSPKFYTSSKRPNASVGTLILGGRTFAKSSWFTWETSASRSYEVDSAGNPKADFSWIGPKVYCNYVPSAQSDPMRPHFGSCDGPDSPLQNATDWAFKDITTSTGLTSQLNLTAALSYAHNYSVGKYFGNWEIGFKITNGHKTQDATETVYDGWPAKAGSAILMTALQSGFHNSDFYNGSYFGGQFGPVSDFNKVQSYTLANLSGDVDGYKTASDTYPNIFHFIERVPAGYAMNTIDINRLRIQTGLRFEATQMNTFGYQVTLYPAGSSKCGGSTNTGCGVPVPETNNPSYLDALPSVQARYKLTSDSDIRAVYARGVARPDPYQLIPYATEDETASPVSVDIGNPALRPEHANNYDLLYEDYLRPLGMLQGGVFVKQLFAPQVEMIIPGNISLANFPAGYFPPALQPVLATYPGDSITQYVNGENAYLYGFELSYQQHLSYLPGVLSGLGVLANYSYTDSREKGLPLRTDQPALIDQAPNTWNIMPSYDTDRLSVRMGLAYNGASLFSYNWIAPSEVTGADPAGLGPTGPNGDDYTLAHFQVDAQASYRAWRGLTVTAVGLNLNNEVFGYYTGSTQFVNQREYYKPTYSGGLRYTFGRER